jgi:hypothetical protein
MRALVRAGVVHVVVNDAPGYRLAAGADAILALDTTGLDSEHGWASHVRHLAGPQVQAELVAHLDRTRSLELGGIVGTGPGKLACRHILHAAALDEGERIEPPAFAAAVERAIGMALEQRWSTLHILVPEERTRQRRHQILEGLTQVQAAGRTAHGHHLMVRFVVASPAFAEELRAQLESWAPAAGDVDTRGEPARAAGARQAPANHEAEGHRQVAAGDETQAQTKALTRGEEDSLVELLEKCAAIRDGATRKLVIDRLPEHIAVRIREFPGLRVHVTEMVKHCSRFPGGLASLRTAVHRFEGDSFAMRELDALLARIVADRP